MNIKPHYPVLHDDVPVAEFRLGVFLDAEGEEQSLCHLRGSPHALARELVRAINHHPRLCREITAQLMQQNFNVTQN
jgi:hypothetical protein